jgi:ABC-type glucose/galactose transport system permease subunit
MHVVRRVLIVIGFVVSWLLLLTRFGQLHFRRSVDEEEPRTSYVNTVGIVTAILWLVPGTLFFAIVSGRVEHQSVHNLLWMSYHLILLLVCVLGGSDLQGAITGVTTFDAVHLDVGFLFTSTLIYALLPQTTHVVVHSHPESRERLIDPDDGVLGGIDRIPDTDDEADGPAIVSERAL